MKQLVISDKAPRGTGPYSPGLIAGDFVFVSGQGPLDPQTHAVVGTTIEEQTRVTLDNVRAILEAAGASLDAVVRVNVSLSDASLYDGYNKVYAEYFWNEPRPCRTTIVSGLFDVMLEVDCIAYLGK
jgi:2-iminobutanoate/2-iminopropanoate deaminase